MAQMYLHISVYMGGCQNDGPFLGTLNIRCCIIIGIQKGTIILTTTHICPCTSREVQGFSGLWGPPWRISQM